MKNILFISYLRVTAMLMILYDHLGGFRNQEWLPVKFMQFYFNKPLELIQDFGALGVSIFYLISGFLLSKNIDEGKIVKFNRYFISKISYIFFSTVIAGSLFLCIQKILFKFFNIGGYWEQFSIKEWFFSITLVKYIISGGDSVIGVTWFIVPLLFFYIITWLLIKVGIRNIEVILVSSSFFAFFNAMILKNFNNLVLENYMYYLTFVNICILGGEMYLLIYKIAKFKIWTIMFIWINMVDMFSVFANQYFEQNKYLVSVVIGMTIFFFFYLLEERMTYNRFICNLDKYSFEIYLLHMTFGSLIISTIENKLNYTICFILANIVIYFLSLTYSKINKILKSIIFRRINV